MSGRPKTSLGRRFMTVLVCTVAAVGVALTAVMVVLDVRRDEKRLEGRLAELTRAGQAALGTALWQYNDAYVQDFVDALFLQEEIVFAEVESEGRVVVRRARDTKPHRRFEAYQGSDSHIASSVTIRHENEAVGQLRLVVTLDSVRQRVHGTIAASVALLLAICAAILLVTYFLLRRYVLHPLRRLQTSAGAVSRGHLDTAIEVESDDEFGQLANAFNAMVGSLKTTMASRDELDREVNRRRGAEKERESLARFPAENPDPVLRIAADGTVMYSNDAGMAVLRHWGTSPGKTTPQAWRETVRRALEDETSLIQEEAVADRILSLAVSPVADAGYANLYARDITDRRRAEDALRKVNVELEGRVAERTSELETRTAQSERLNKAMINLLEDMRETNCSLEEANRKLEIVMSELNASNRELEAFSYSVSHDLRAPLRAVDGFSTALMEDYADRLDEEGLDYLQCLREASQNMARLIDDLLSLSRVTRDPMRMEPVDLGEIAASVVLELRDVEPERDVAFSTSGDLLAASDPGLMRVVLMNLLGNAWKFTRGTESPRVEFGVVDQDGETVYHVRDNGTGFDMAHVDKLFGPFQRLHAAADFEGSGIGLATVQRVIRRHGGCVWAEGSPGEGATFYFVLGART